MDKERNIDRETNLIIDSSRITTTHHHAACTFVSIMLPNGLVLAQSHIKKQGEKYDGYKGHMECMKVIKESIKQMIEHNKI